MRGLLSLMLAIPLAVGCGGDEKSDDESDENGWSDSYGGEGSSGGAGYGGSSPGGAGSTLTGTAVFGATVSVCDGERLEAPPGGFVCTDVNMPEDPAYGLLEVESSAAVMVPLFEQDGKWVTIAPLMADRQGLWSGAVTYSIYDKAGNALTSVEGVIAASEVPVSDAANELSNWREALESAWADLPGTAGRDVGYRLGLLTGLFQESLVRTYAPMVISSVPVEMDATAGEAVARALQQHRTELAAAGLDTEWSALDSAHIRGTMSLLPSAVVLGAGADTDKSVLSHSVEADGTTQFDTQNFLALGPAVVALAPVAGVVIAGVVVAIIFDAFLDKIMEPADNCATDICNDSLKLWRTKSRSAYQCLELNSDEPLAAELDELLPGLDELDSLTADDLTQVAEGYYPDECCDSVDNDGNGETDECCVELRNCSRITIDWSTTEEQFIDLQSCVTMLSLHLYWDSPILLPHLEAIEDDLWLDGGGKFTAPSLKSIGELKAQSNVLTAIELPALESVTEAVRISDGDNLSTIDLPSLEYVGHEFRVVGVNGITTIELPALESAGSDNLEFDYDGDGISDTWSVVFSSNPSLVRIETPKLSVPSGSVYTVLNAPGCIHDSPVCYNDCRCDYGL